MKIPNLLTVLRLCLVPVIIFFLYKQDTMSIIVSIVLFGVAISTDWLDGFIARKYNLKSVFGTFLDPIVDKLLILSIFFIFVDFKLIPLWLVLLMLLREFLASGVRLVCSSKKKVVGANWMGKSKFILQSIVIGYAQFVLLFEYMDRSIAFFSIPVIFYATLLVAVLSLASIINFMWWHRKELFSDF